jgi:hypothetical protein
MPAKNVHSDAKGSRYTTMAFNAYLHKQISLRFFLLMDVNE